MKTKYVKRIKILLFFLYVALGTTQGQILSKKMLLMQNDRTVEYVSKIHGDQAGLFYDDNSSLTASVTPNFLSTPDFSTYKAAYDSGNNLMFIPAEEGGGELLIYNMEQTYFEVNPSPWKIITPNTTYNSGYVTFCKIIDGRLVIGHSSGVMLYKILGDFASYSDNSFTVWDSTPATTGRPEDIIAKNGISGEYYYVTINGEFAYSSSFGGNTMELVDYEIEFISIARNGNYMMGGGTDGRVYIQDVLAMPSAFPGYFVPQYSSENNTIYDNSWVKSVTFFTDSGFGRVYSKSYLLSDVGVLIELDPHSGDKAVPGGYGYYSEIVMPSSPTEIPTGISRDGIGASLHIITNTGNVYKYDGSTLVLLKTGVDSFTRSFFNY